MCYEATEINPGSLTQVMIKIINITQNERSDKEVLFG
jgi:hypothetical protein